MALYLLKLIQYVGVMNLLSAVTISLMVVWFISKNWMPYHNLPPGPPLIPFPFDSLLAFFPTGNRFRQLMAINKRYGDIACLRVGQQLRVLISSPELVKELIIKRADVTSNRNVIPFLQYIMDYTGGIIFSDGEPWQELRRFSLSALRNFGMGRRSIEHRIKDEAKILCNTIGDLSGKPFDPMGLLNAAVSNIICAITFGKRFDYDDLVFMDMIRRLKTITSGIDINPIIHDLMIRIPVLLKTPLARNSKDNLLGLKGFINKEIDRHVNTYDPSDIRDIIDMYLAEVARVDSAQEKTFLNRDTMWMCVFDLFLAGTETTSTALLWFLLIMAGKPEIQQKVFNEIDHIIGRERAPSIEDRKNMPFTDATLTEVLRYRPIAPLGVPHVNDRDIKVRGYTIPKNTEIMISIIGMHLDPELWDDPEEFNPKRFLNEDESSFTKNDAFIVFGAGRRICLGEQLARMEFFLFATTLLQRFEFVLRDGEKPDYDFAHCLGTIAPKTYEVIARER